MAHPISFKVLATVALAFAAVASAAEAAEGPLSFDYCFASQLQTMKHSDSLSVSLSNGYGTFESNPPGGKFDGMSSQCMSVFAVNEGQVNVNGYCEWLNLDGDKLLISFERSGTADGKFRSISGTGKLQSMKVEGTYTTGKFPQRQGVSVNCAKITGRWSQP
jgi:hypothetical protein